MCETIGVELLRHTHNECLDFEVIRSFYFRDHFILRSRECITFRLSNRLLIVGIYK